MTMTDYVAIPGPLGAMLVAADERAVLGLSLIHI